jgi:hypothetical protein
MYLLHNLKVYGSRIAWDPICLIAYRSLFNFSKTYQVKNDNNNKYEVVDFLVIEPKNQSLF